MESHESDTCCMTVWLAVAGTELVRWWTAACGTDVVSWQASRCLSHWWAVGIPRLWAASSRCQGHQKVSSALAA